MRIVFYVIVLFLNVVLISFNVLQSGVIDRQRSLINLMMKNPACTGQPSQYAKVR